ncbi:MAG: imidazolonepropionase [Candidatus Eisenbacteria bacterium]|nr:imidazolonepropionase [Candidatus Eisenbacteria bacterium]
MNVVVRHAGVLVTCAGDWRPRAGAAAHDLGIVTDGAVVMERGRIVWVGRDTDVPAGLPDSPEVDAARRLVTPGLVDCHTHALFAGSRAGEFAMRVCGSTYEEIMAQGGGISASARMLREAPDADILEQTAGRLWRMLRFGTTTCEIKSGYGLSTEQEVRSLRLIQQLRSRVPIRVVPTFLGAHAIPPEWRYDREGFVRQVTEEMIPQVAREELARFCDVFCEHGAFSVEESRRILETARAHGMDLKIHADELASSGGTRLGAELGVCSADHLLCATRGDLEALRDSGAIAVMLPGTCLGLAKTRYAPGRLMAEIGLPVAVASDLNPGNCYCENLPLMVTLACLYGGLSLEQALVGVTINAAHALRLGDEVGSLEPGKRGDLVIWECDDYRDIAYHFGVQLASIVIAGGVVAAP